MFTLRLAPILLSVIMLLSACQSTNEIEPIEESTQPVTEAIVLEESFEPIPYPESQLYLDNIQSGGVPPDGIPSVDDPEFITITEAKSLYNDHDQMFIVELDGQVYLYPQSILVWHEIVNMSSHNAAVTYCPLTGSAITYRYPDHITTQFGTSGTLLNSNLVMYDRITGSNISQIDGVGLDGQLEGYVLENIPTHWIDFVSAAALHEDALVLSQQTGYIRDYQRDPYGSYTAEPVGNYYISPGVMFPLIHTPDDLTIAQKQPMIGIKGKDAYLALNKLSVIDDEPLHFDLGQQAMTAVYDASIENVRVFNGTLSIVDGALTDNDNGLWSLDGNSLSGAQSLASPLYFEVMWFAWYAFYPETEVI